jgi:membrane glycosyltransferase
MKNQNKYNFFSNLFISQDTYIIPNCMLCLILHWCTENAKAFGGTHFVILGVLILSFLSCLILFSNRLHFSVLSYILDCTGNSPDIFFCFILYIGLYREFP